MPEITGALLNGRYRLDSELGQGGMGTVYCAHDTLLKRDVAVKVLSRAGLGTEGRARLLREAQAVAQLNHPNVVSVYDAGEAELPGSVGTVPFIVMELVVGDSLHDCPPGSLDEILAIACQLCTALEHAHAEGIIHRDLKPENVLVLPDGSAKLVDFGLARTVSSRLTAEGAVLGTVSYIAPEQALGREIDGRADLYTLGVMLYEWTTGRLPFTGDDPLALIGQHLHASVVPPQEHAPEIPPALDALIVQLMSKQPEDRPASAADVRQVLEGLVRAEVAAEVLPDRPRRPAFLEEARETVERPLLVARERELARLDSFLESTLAGQGHVVFVTGGPGRGKTALLAEFACRAMEARADLLVANGNCNAYSGVGDPYLPFRDIFGQLTGDVEAAWAAGTITRDHALRLWDALPLAAQALLDHGPEIVPALLSGPALLSRARRAAPVGAPWLQQLRQWVEPEISGSEDVEQSHLFQQVTNLLRALAVGHPLLLILDDLQWVDASSSGLLFHLGRRLGGSRILVVGAYRPEEVALGREGVRHPLEQVQAEFRRLYGEVVVDLSRDDSAESRMFVDELLDTEPNELGEDFRQALFAHTGGHALFTIELLRAMQERGDLVRRESGPWVEGTALDWDTLPARVEAVIEERIGRLGQESKELLTTASVEGAVFTAQVVAQVQEVDERSLIRQLSLELGRRHRLVRDEGIHQAGGHRLYKYRFAHSLIQQSLYKRLGDIERELLHGDVGMALEALYAADAEQIAPQLAFHFSRAGIQDKALHYLTQAGNLARGRYAHQEAIDYYCQALTMVPSKDRETRFELLLNQEGVRDVQGDRKAQAADLAALASLADELGDGHKQAKVALRQAQYAEATSDYPAAIDRAQRAASLAQECGDLKREAAGLSVWGRVLRSQGDLDAARARLEAALALARSAALRTLEAQGLRDLGVIAWQQGAPAEAEVCFKQSLRICQEIGDRRAAGAALNNLGNAARLQGDHGRASDAFQQALRVRREIGDRWGQASTLINLGYLRTTEGDYATARTHLQQALHICREIAFRRGERTTLQCMGELSRRLGDYAAAKTYLEQDLRISREIGDPLSEGEALTGLGLILHLQGDNDAALQTLLEARNVLQEQGTPSYQPYGLTDLGHVQASLGRLTEAAATYRQAADLRRALGQECLAMEAVAGLAAVALAQRRLAHALAHVEEILDYLEVHCLDAADDPARVYVTCYRVLRAAHDPRAEDVLAKGHDLLLEQADKIESVEERSSFLQNVHVHREIVAAYHTDVGSG